MSREIRITIDDDEVFERMKARKRDLDLSWEDVLHRGLRLPEPDEPADPRDPADGSPHEPHAGPGSGPDLGERRGVHSPPEPESIGDVVDEMKRQVRHSLRESMSAMGDVPGDLEREVGALEKAEDATLRFEVLDERPEYGVPLRVNLRTSRDGLDVEVVAIRRGKDARGTNRFDREARRRVNEHLARGGAATLSFDGEEAYTVAPVLSWGREEGQPVVDAVEIEEVVFDDDV